MKTTLLLIAIATSLVGGNLSASTQPGWGQKQTQRTVSGGITGGTIGGIIGHQHGKQKEGIIPLVISVLIQEMEGAQNVWEMDLKELRCSFYLMYF